MYASENRNDNSMQYEEMLVGKMRRGDADAQRMLVERTMWVAEHAARRYASRYNHAEDLLSVACLGLAKALNGFEAGRESRFSSYATRCVQNEILMYLRRKKGRVREVSLEQQLPGEEEGKGLCLSDVLCTDDEPVVSEVVRNEDYQELKQVLSMLDAQGKRILEMRFGLDVEREHTQKEVAEILGLTQSCVSKKERKLLRTIKEIMER